MITAHYELYAEDPSKLTSENCRKYFDFLKQYVNGHQSEVKMVSVVNKSKVLGKFVLNISLKSSHFDDVHKLLKYMEVVDSNAYVEVMNKGTLKLWGDIISVSE